MNKLYIIRYTLHGRVIHVRTFWNLEEYLVCLALDRADTWEIAIVENNAIHTVAIAK